MKNVILASHIASVSVPAVRKLRETAARLAVMALNWEPLPNVVNGLTLLLAFCVVSLPFRAKVIRELFSWFFWCMLWDKNRNTGEHFRRGFQSGLEFKGLNSEE